MKKLASIGMFVILCATATYPQAVQSTSAAQIIDKVASLYATCDTYMDDGQVTEVFVKPDRSYTVIKPFATAFVRPGEFRFEFRKRHGLGGFMGEEMANDMAGWDSFIAWKHDDLVKSWIPLKPPYETQTTLSFALAGLTGISSSAAILIPRLLMPDQLPARSILALTGANLVAEESIDGRVTYKIEGKNFQDLLVTLWIDKQKLTILKMYVLIEFKDFKVKKTNLYHPQVNIKIPADKLAFNRPGDKVAKK